MRVIVSAAVLGLVGCTPALAIGLLRVGTSGGGDGVELRGNDPERMCAGATPGRARHECLAAHGVDDTPPTTEQDRLNAETRATGARLERERAETAKCLVAPTGPRESPIAAHLDRELVASGISTVITRVRSCRHSSLETGQVLVNVTVSARGCVVAIAIESTSDPDLGACVAAALGYATFAATETGGAFRYPYKL